MYTTKYRSFASPISRMNHFLNEFQPNENAGKSPRTGVTIPSANIKESDEKYFIELAAPGFEKSDFQIKAEQNILSISSEKKQEVNSESEKYTRKEFVYASFTRAFNIPDSIEVEAIQATYENGVLKIQLPKKPEVIKENARQISVS